MGRKGSLSETVLNDEGIVGSNYTGYVTSLWVKNINITVYINEIIEYEWIPLMVNESNVGRTTFCHLKECYANISCLSVNCSLGKVSYNHVTFILRMENFYASETGN